jgi:hypothetical protein
MVNNLSVQIAILLLHRYGEGQRMMNCFVMHVGSSKEEPPVSCFIYIDFFFFFLV